MPTEYESKFLDVNVAELRGKLKDIGAKLSHKNIRYVRCVYSLCHDIGKGYFRVRQEGDKVTMTSKSYLKSADFPEENEVEVKNTFEEAAAFAKSLNTGQIAFQETMREKWSHPLAHEIVIDTIPGIPTYVEIDCDDESKMNQLVDLLQLDKSKQRFGAFDRVYDEYYGITRQIINYETPSLTFAGIHEEIKPLKNHELLLEVQKQQLEMLKSINGGITPRHVNNPINSVDKTIRSVDTVRVAHGSRSTNSRNSDSRSPNSQKTSNSKDNSSPKGKRRSSSPKGKRRSSSSKGKRRSSSGSSKNRRRSVSKDRSTKVGGARRRNSSKSNKGGSNKDVTRVIYGNYRN